MAKKKKTVEKYNEDYFSYVIQIYSGERLIYFSKAKEKVSLLNTLTYLSFFENQGYPCKIQIDEEKYEEEFTRELVERIKAQN